MKKKVNAECGIAEGVKGPDITMKATVGMVIIVIAMLVAQLILGTPNWPF